MTKETFQKQIERLQANYRETDYKEERVALFWRALEKTSDHVFVEAIDELIANKRSAPMLQEISEAVEEARVRDAERRADWSRSQFRGRDNVIDIVETLAERSSAFARECVDLLKKRKLLPPEEWEGHMKLLEEATRNTGRCLRCDGTGIVLANGVYRCACPRGQAISEKAYGAVRADGAREYVTIPTIKL